MSARPAKTPLDLTEPVKFAMDKAEVSLSAAGTQRRRHQTEFHWHIVGVVLSACVLAMYLGLGPARLGIPTSHAQTTIHVVVALFLTAIIIAGQRLSDVLIDKRTLDDNVTFFNLRLVVRLVAAVLICLVLLSVISQTWYTVPVALGVFSIVIGFALQMPMASFVGWTYILVRKPYRVGDRIKIAGATGDVIDISYFDTTLWEFGGQYLSTDHPSGRVIKFPNATVLNTPVYNYSWSLFPYIWDEIRLYVAYDSDLDFVSGIMLAVAKDEVGEQMAERVRAYRCVLDRTPVDQLDVREEPTVFFRVNEDGWLDAVVRYLVDPKEAGRTKTVILRKMLAKLNEQPNRVLFPKWR
jgi:small-conductance mechanosensitive channel